MTKGQLPVDANRNPLHNGDWVTAVKTMTFDGATTDDPGDVTGQGNPATLFTVTGVVLARFFAFCSVNLAGATATIEVGTTKTTTALLALSQATDIDANEIWHDTTPDTDVEAFTVATERIVAGSIIQTVRTADITAGTLTYYCLWRPLSDDGNVVAA